MKKIYTLSIALLFSVMASYAQYYYIPKSIGQNPKNLNTDNEYPVGGGLDASWTTFFTGPGSPSSWLDLTLPFQFNFNGNNFSSAKVSTNGVLTFTASPSGVPIDANQSLPHSSIPDNSITCWGITIGTGDYIVTKTFGTAPNRQFWVQFNSCSEPGLPSGYIYMSIVLEETTNNFYIVDQRSNDKTTSLTLGVQINAQTAVMVAGSPNYTTKNSADPSPADNVYYGFRQGVQPANDITMISIGLEKNLSAKNSPFSIACDVFNAGSDPVTSAKITYQIDQNPEVSVVVNGLNIPKFGTGTITSTIKWAQTDVTVSNVKVTISEVNNSADINPDDNSLTKQVNVWEDCVTRKTLFEGFTSSTCGPCVLGNINLHKVLDVRPGKFTVVKYQMAFPSPGDPYVTAEGKSRQSYYAVTGIPNGEIDGQWNANTQGITTTIFDSYQEKPSFLKINASQTLTGNKLDFSATITPVKQFTSTKYKMFLAIVERTTSNNASSNGETEFNWVMKKMLPNQSGFPLVMPAKNGTFTQTASWTVPGSYRLPADGQATNMINLATENSVEELWDLVGVVWVQDTATKEVLQSEWTLPVGATLGTKEIKIANMAMSIFPNPAHNTFTIKLDKNIDHLNMTITNLTGQSVLSKDFGKGLESEVDCSSLPNGIYVVTISNGETKTTQKLIINR